MIAPRQRVISLVAAFAISALAVACDASAPLIGSSDEPGLYLVLSREPDTDAPLGAPTDSALFALLVTSGRATAAAYRAAQQFTFTRRADGAQFAWVDVPRSGTAQLANGGLSQSAAGNLRLPWVGSGGRLGRDSLQPGARYDLELTSEGRLIAGSATLPGVPTLTVERTGATTTMHWAKSVGAAGYWVIVDTDDPGAFITSDTSYALRRDRAAGGVPAVPRFRVIAVDTNLLAMVVDSTRRQSGLSGAFGVFGGVSSDAVNIPP